MAVLSEGKILVAHPQLKDPAFEKSVILLFGNDPAQGAFGINIAKAWTERASDEILATFKTDPLAAAPPSQRRLHVGGPLPAPFFFLLQKTEGPLPSGKPLAQTGFWMSPFDINGPFDLSNNPPQAVEKALMAINYAGWGAGQLEEEIDMGAWRVADLTLDALLGHLPEERWMIAAQKAGFFYKPGGPSGPQP